jgi:hypothetical protein
MVLAAGVSVVTTEGRGLVLAASPVGPRVLVSFGHGRVVEIVGDACSELLAVGV